MAEFKKLTYVDGALWFNGQLVATVSDEWIRGNIQTIKNILEVSSGGPGVAADVSYDNTISQILATNVQTAIDEIHEEIDDRAGACEARLDVVEDNIEGLVDSINIEVIPEELGDTVGDAISSINDSLNNLVKFTSTKLLDRNTTYIVEDTQQWIKVIKIGNYAVIQIALYITGTIGGTYTRVGTLPQEALYYIDGIMASEGGYGCHARRNGTDLEVRNVTKSNAWYGCTVIGKV